MRHPSQEDPRGRRANDIAPALRPWWCATLGSAH
ncbi:hypothetical protein QO006_001413 [Deinococcus enclensis]|uniref:Uncharacterized protein n=1 Tax=Deinococcus enclensis TaxID=1049582 RepID=A0ABT9MBN1_9DEIO|nr:hypothetical protein [Deinococcus enclensis]